MVRRKKYNTLARDGERGRRGEGKASSNEALQDWVHLFIPVCQGCRGSHGVEIGLSHRSIKAGAGDLYAEGAPGRLHLLRVLGYNFI